MRQERASGAFRIELRVLLAKLFGPLGVAALVAITVTMFALAVPHDTFVGDLTIFKALRFEDPDLQAFFSRFDPAGVVAAVPAAIGLAFVVRRKVREGLAFLLVLPAQGLTVLLPKVLIGRPRPPGGLAGDTDSFPSGNAASAMMVGGLLIYMVGMYVSPGPLRIALQVIIGGVVLALGMFRILASEHWPSDVLGGYLIGALVVIGIVWAYRRLGGGAGQRPEDGPGHSPL